MEDNLKGRQLNERQPERKTISMKDDDFVLITFNCKAKQQLMVVALLWATLYMFLYQAIGNIEILFLNKLRNIVSFYNIHKKNN